MQLSSVLKLATLLSFVAAQEAATATTTETQQQAASPTDTTSPSSTTTTTTSTSSAADTSSTTTTADTGAANNTTSSADTSSSVDTSATPPPPMGAANSTESRTVVSVSTEQVTNNGSTSMDLSSRDVFVALRSTVTFFENSTTGTYTTINELTTAPPPPIFQNVTENNGNTSSVLLNSDASRPLFTQTDSIGNSVTYFMGAGAALNAYGGAVPGALIAAVFGLLW